MIIENNMDTINILQHYWWAIVSLLGALLVLLLFVQGGQTMLFGTAKTEDEKKLVIAIFGHKWELTFTTLVTFGGAAFASFPLFYSTSFGGAYWLWISILLLFVIQAVSYEYRNKAGNLLGSKTYDGFLFLNGMFGTILLGVAVGTLFTGGAYVMDKFNITEPTSPTVSYWVNDYRGLEAIINPFNLLLGITVYLAAKTLGLLYLSNFLDGKRDKISTTEVLAVDSLLKKAKFEVKYMAPIFVLMFVVFLVALFTLTGYEVKDGFIEPVKFKYFFNMIQVVFPIIVLLLGVVLVLVGIVPMLFDNLAKDCNFINWIRKNSFYVTGLGVVLAVFSILVCAAFNNTAYFPSTVNIEDSLTLANSSSSLFTLTVMSYVSIAVPFVLAYIIVVWRKMNRGEGNTAY